MSVILLIDEDVLQARLILDRLVASGHAPLWSGECWDALVTYHRVRPDLVIMAAAPPRAVEWLRLLHSMRGTSQTPILLIADLSPLAYYLAKLNVACCMVKPVDIDVLIQQIHVLVPRATLDRRHAAALHTN